VASSVPVDRNDEKEALKTVSSGTVKKPLPHQQFFAPAKITTKISSEDTFTELEKHLRSAAYVKKQYKWPCSVAGIWTTTLHVKKGASHTAYPCSI